MRIDPALASRLDARSLSCWDEDGATICAVWSDGRLAFYNRAWDRFAIDNGGTTVVADWPVGRSIWDAIPTPLRAFYQDAFAGALATGEPYEHEYECSTPTHRRSFHLRALAIAERAALLVVHSLSRVELHPGVIDAAEEAYVEATGFVVQCSHCRRVRMPDGSDRWDFVPAYVACQRGNISHGLCAPCLELHYGPTRG